MQLPQKSENLSESITYKLQAFVAISVEEPIFSQFQVLYYTLGLVSEYFIKYF